MIFLFHYKSKLLQKFTDAMRSNNKDVLIDICRPDCKFINFKDKQGTLESILKYNYKKKNVSIKDVIWHNGKHICRTSWTHYDVLNILGIDHLVRLTLRFKFKYLKLHYVKVMEYSFTINDKKQWAEYQEYFNAQLDSKESEPLQNTEIASRYMQSLVD